MKSATRPLPDEGQGLFAGSVRKGFRAPEQLRPSQWAEKYRVLSRRQSSRPGPWRNENAPPLAVVMDLCVRRTIRELWIKKAGQVGVSEAFRNVIAYWAVNEPDPLLLVLPNEKDGRKIVRKRIIPLFEDTECLAALATGSTRDKKLTAITLSNGFDLQLGWSGSPSSLASDPIRRTGLDEVDKFEQFSGAEASPVDLARVRLKTYVELEQSILVAISTPTTSAGAISVGFEDCPIKLHFFAPCPHCGRFQRLVFDRLGWEKFKDLPDAKSRAARIKARKAAWYECAACSGRIVEAHKRAMLCAGYFGTEDGSWKLYCDGREEGKQPEGDKVGLHYGGLIDLSTSFTAIAAEFVEADGRPEKLMSLYNSTLGEEYRDRVIARTVGTFAAKCRPDPEKGFVPAKAKVVPLWASRLLMAVDTQQDYFWFVIRAFGHQFRSQRIHHGRASSFDELEELLYRGHFPYEGDKYPPLTCFLSGIDSGGGLDRDRGSATRTDQVYQWCLKDPLKRLPLKGASKPFDEHIRWRDVEYQDPHQKRDPYRVRLHFIDPLYWRDLKSSYIAGVIPQVDPATGEVTGDVEQWALNDYDDDEYNRHLSNVTKVKLREGSKIVERWTTKTVGAHKDYDDCETYLLALAHGPAACFALPTAEQLARQRQAARDALNPSQNPAPAAAPGIIAPAGGVRMPDGRPFLSRR